MRKLASIQKIADLESIPGADNIERTKIMGWWCVTKKNAFKIGDKCLYCEVDSFLPVIPQFEFLSKGSAAKKMIVDGQDKLGYRLKTIVLRNQISQGLAIPLTEFPELQNLEIGTDVTQQLDILIYEKPVPACLSGQVVGCFPGNIKMTDEDRIQIRQDILEEYKGRTFYRTVKLDGTSMTVYNHSEDFFVCGRTLNFLEKEGNTFQLPVCKRWASLNSSTVFKACESNSPILSFFKTSGSSCTPHWTRKDWSVC